MCMTDLTDCEQLSFYEYPSVKSTKKHKSKLSNRQTLSVPQTDDTPANRRSRAARMPSGASLGDAS